jgi:hypothetical protein
MRLLRLSKMNSRTRVSEGIFDALLPFEQPVAGSIELGFIDRLV